MRSSLLPRLLNRKTCSSKYGQDGMVRQTTYVPRRLPLEQAPEVFQPVRVDATVHIFISVIHDLVNIMPVGADCMRTAIVGIDAWRHISRSLKSGPAMSRALHTGITLVADLACFAVQHADLRQSCPVRHAHTCPFTAA